MRYCYHCRQLTPGEPLFCNHCGRSYDSKLCPRRHSNPRSARVCSQCGSQDLSTPQPKASWTQRALITLLEIAPGIALILLSLVMLIVLARTALYDHQPSGRLLVATGLLALLWMLYIGWSGLVRKTYRRGPPRRLRHRSRRR